MRPRARSRLRPSALAAVLAAALALPAGAAADEAGSFKDSAGGVEATVLWDAAEFGVANPRLRIVRPGVLYESPLTDVCAEGCTPSELRVADLDRDGEPEVVVDTYSGGAHCCTAAHVYGFRAGSHDRLTVEWGNSGYRLADLGGDRLYEMVGTDDAFAYAFTAYALSARPVKVVRYARGADGAPGTVDVTRKFPKRIRSDARRLLRIVRKAKRGDDMRGVLAAYVADQYLLRRGRAGLREVDRARRRGLLAGGGGPEGRAYRSALLRFLRTHGYR